MDPTPEQVGWTAGVVDSEGCISAYGCKHRQYPGKVWSLKVLVVNTDIRMIVRLRELWGGRVRSRAKVRDPKRHRACWLWELCGHRACDFLWAIRHELVVKREQADLAIEFGNLMNTSGDTRKVGEDNLRRREELSAQLKLAKHVGLNEKVSE